ncbi:transporter [Sphingomonas crusticola]|uniref:transporter n=1 Tax=Sphingomonas crusticola TaxID=1697973 RepID=UPI0013C36471|nr:transporter [Sphingomonas crusticola]
MTMALACSLLAAALAEAAPSAAGAPPQVGGLVADKAAQDGEIWLTGSLFSNTAATLPKGHILIEPYLYDSITTGSFSAAGSRSAQPVQHGVRQLTLILYGLTDRLTLGALPQFGYNDTSALSGRSRVGFGDLPLRVQYKINDFTAGRFMPTVSVAFDLILPTGAYQNLGSFAPNALGTGAHTARLATYLQRNFPIPGIRTLRARLNISYSISSRPSVAGRSSYATPPRFRGQARLGDAFSLLAATEFSLTQNWAVALDYIYARAGKTVISGDAATRTGAPEGYVSYRRIFPRSESFELAPAVEYNLSSRVGLIAGASISLWGRNSPAGIRPAIALNTVF